MRACTQGRGWPQAPPPVEIWPRQGPSTCNRRWHTACSARGMRGMRDLVSWENFPRVSPWKISLQPSDELLAQNVLRRPPELAVGGLVDDVPAAGGGDDRLHGPGEEGRGLAAIPVQEVRRRLRIIDFGLYSSTQHAGEMCESMSSITTMVSAIAESPIPGRTKGSRGDKREDDGKDAPH